MSEETRSRLRRVDEAHRQQLIELSELLKAIQHPARLCILCQLDRYGEVQVSDLVNCMDMSQSSVSQHLSKLRDRGIVAATKRGKAVYYSIKDPRVHQWCKYFFEEENEL